jgi:hypothetical protein
MESAGGTCTALPWVDYRRSINPDSLIILLVSGKLCSNALLNISLSVLAGDANIEYRWANSSRLNSWPFPSEHSK